MVKELRIYFEGDKLLRPGFRQFLTEIVTAARARRCHCRPVAAEGTPVQDYYDGIKANPEAWNVLLLDSDVPVDCPLEEMCRRKGIEPSLSGSVFWMVQIMESWFFADVEALRAHFGHDIPAGNPKVEEIPKRDLLQRLDDAARRKYGRRYHKTKDAIKLLEMTDPAKVRRSARNCERMFRVILQKLAED